VRTLALVVALSACADSDPVEGNDAYDDPCSNDKTTTIRLVNSNAGFLDLVERCRSNVGTCGAVCDVVFTPDRNGEENLNRVTECEVEFLPDDVLRVSGRVTDDEACDG
jgi:hypothetical protein